MSAVLIVEVRAHTEHWDDPNAPEPTLYTECRAWSGDVPRQLVVHEINDMVRRVLDANDGHAT